MADTSGLPPEGWYPDRPNATRLRHWTGTGWTNEFRPLEPTPQEEEAPAEVQPDTVRETTVRETTDQARSRRELRAQVGSLVAGEPDAATEVEHPAPEPQPVAAAPAAALAVVAAPVALPVEPEPVIRPLDPTLSPTNRARVAGGFDPVREQGWQESFAARAAVPTGSSQTFAGWLYSLSPLWLGALVIAGTTLLSLVNPYLVQVGLGLLGFAMTFLLARQDIRLLAHRGYRAPSLWWVLLPFFYFVARLVRVGVKSVGMVIAYLLSSVALVALLYLTLIGYPSVLASLVPSIPADSSSIPTPVVTLSPQERANLLTPEGVEAQLRVDLAATFEVGDLSCVPFPDLEEGTTTTCVVSLDGVDYNAGLQVTPNEPSTAFVVTGMLPVAG